MWKATIRGLLAHKVRLGLSALAVVLGISFVTATYVFTDTGLALFENLFDEIATGSDVTVRSAEKIEGQGFFEAREAVPAELLPEIQEVPGVEAAAGFVQGYAQVVDKAGKPVTPAGAPTFAFSWPEHAELTPYRVREGRRPERDGEVAIDAATVRLAGYRLGDRVTVVFEGPSGEFTLVGIAGFGKADNLLGATAALFDTPTAQRLLRMEGRFTEINAAAVSGVSATELRGRIAAVLPADVEAITGSAEAEEGKDDLRQGFAFFRIGLLAFAGIALFVSAFLIFNTFSIVIAQRARDFALLRAVGATGGQVTRSVLIEGLVVGVFASLLGFALGIGLGAGLRALFNALGAGLPGGPLKVQPRTFVIAMVIGIVVTLIASIAPARRASRVPPVAAMQAAVQPDIRRGSPRRRAAIGSVVSGVGLALVLLGLFGSAGSPALSVAGGLLLLFVGVSMLAPFAARPLSRAIGWPLPRAFGPAGRLARENSARDPYRTASTAAALMVGLALVTLVAVFATSAKASAGKAIEETLRADFIIQNESFQARGLSPEAADRLRTVAGVSDVIELRRGPARLGGDHQNIDGLDPRFVDAVGLEIVSGSTDALVPGSVFVRDDVVEDRGVAPGDALEFEFTKTGRQRFTIAGVYREARILGSYLVPLTAYEQHFTDQFDSAVLVRTAPGADTTATRAGITAALRDFPTVSVQTAAEFRKEQEDQINQLLGLVYALLMLAVVIALLGITNTLALSVFERTRELGLLRAVGMSRRQVRRMVRWESVVISILGAGLGIVLGLAFGLLLVTSLRNEGIDVVGLPFAQLFVFVVLAAVAGMAAAAFPARRAARLDVLQAIITE